MSEPANPKRVHITTYGCQMNEYDSSRMAGLLAEMGYTPVERPEEADLILLNTCSVRERAAHKVYSQVGALKALKDRRPHLIIGVAGCLAQQEGDRLLEHIPHLDMVVGTGALQSLPQLVADADQGRRRSHTPQPREYRWPPPRVNSGLKALVTVMAGCDNFCTYCVVPYVRGRERSRPAGEIAQEVAALVESGAREITLLGQNVNSYRDPRDGLDFPGLLERLARTPGLWRLRFTTCHPKDLSPRLMEVMAGEETVMEGLHLPVQAGSDRVLAAMGRGYTRSQYLELVQRLRRVVPGVALGGDMIVGFPGESEEDFQQTLAIIDEVGYDFLYSFKYSDRPFTRARRLADKLSEEIKSRRLLELQERQRQRSLALHQEMVGQVAQVLVEGPAKKGTGLMSGRDRGGRAVNFPGGAELKGRLVRVEITQGLVNSLKGRLIQDPNKGVQS